MRRSVSQRGFGLIEVLIAVLILTVGLVGLASLFGVSVATTYQAQESLLAKQLAREALESIFTARNTHQITFDQIRNVAAGGIFLDGLLPVTTPGPDGLVGTADDGPEVQMVLAGPDGVVGTGDDVIRRLTGYRRQIQIDPIIRPDGSIDANLRQVTVTIQYPSVRGPALNYRVGTYVSRFR
ncbi:MAG TPA: type IV pilus modification protein PilV [Terriglobia bacterium]|nr:type IV pilus modification protein PilV [Terriglobia bacterium]